MTYYEYPKINISKTLNKIKEELYPFKGLACATDVSLQKKQLT